MSSPAGENALVRVTGVCRKQLQGVQVCTEGLWPVSLSGVVLGTLPALIPSGEMLFTTICGTHTETCLVLQMRRWRRQWEITSIAEGCTTT